MSNVIPKEKQTAYQRWEMASFDDLRPVAPVKQHADIADLAEQLAASREEARLAGYAEGLAEGRAQGLEQGLTQGMEQGMEQGLAEGRAQALQEKLRLQELAIGFSSEIANANERISESLLELALDLAKAMLKNALAIKPELVLPVVDEAIHYLPSMQQPALLFLHPEDAELVRGMMGDELTVSGWRIVEEQIERGGCRVETASNQVDATVETRWQRLVSALGKNSDWLS